VTTRDRIAQLVREGREAQDAGENARAARLLNEAIVLLEQEISLPGGGQTGNTGNQMVTKRNVRVSLRAVAEAVGVSHSLLSQARGGSRRIKRSLAEQIARITPDMPATRATWPLGWVPEDEE